MVVGIGGIEVADVSVSKVVPADLVDGTVRRHAETVLVESSLDEMFRRGLAAHAVIDDGETVRPQQMFEMLGPGLAFAREDIERCRAADQGDHGLALQLVGVALAATPPLRVDVGDFAGAARDGRRHLAHLQKGGQS